ncbi:MAG TPA: ATP-binding cassette domain-containing protein [Mesotoga sp.]|nr:ATP-binding cassette domain-containing protein [Mesotoga sp.]HOY26210.1 ATP-binding cassette domain-containing protein [Mesotoga sp.]HPB62638.1 ATP-binding cassette domain-containing protein [Mesotoga sp.]HQQ55837.1 ATP-binding cassette domain-containing protein [Mesotoga sp.]
MQIVNVENLQKNYTVYQRKGLFREKRIIRALQNISFTVNRGEFLGYIGPNGAGKSTTIKILTGIMTPDGGSAIVDGMVPYRERKLYVRNIGVVFGQKTQLWWDLPVRDTYSLLKAIYGVPESRFKEQIGYLSGHLELGEIMDRPVRQLSLGQRMRAELAAALVHDPELLFLDEPTIGLDIVSKHRVLQFLRELHSRGKTIFLTTHDLKDIEALCQEILIINHGSLVYKGTLEGLKGMVKLPRVLKIQLREGAFSLDGRCTGFIERYAARYDSKTGTIDVELSDTARPANVAREFMQVMEIEDFRITDPSIEDVVRVIYRK